MSAVLAALSVAWHFLLENPLLVGSVLGTAAGALFYVRRLLNLRLKPEDRDRVLAIALPLIAAAKALAEKTGTKWDDVVVSVAERIATELQKEGLDQPGAAPLVIKHLADPAEVEAVTAELVAKALKAGK